LAMGFLPVLRGARLHGGRHRQNWRRLAARPNPRQTGAARHSGTSARRGPAFPQSLVVRIQDRAGRRYSTRQGGSGHFQGGVVTSKVGAELPPGEFLAEPGQKGIWRTVLGPGKHRLNPYGYQIDIVDAISIPVGYVGVVTSLSGKQTTPDAFAGPGEKGVRQDILQPGLYYVNPKELQVDLLEIGVNQVSLLGKTGGEVITKGQIASQNAAMENLQKRALAEQMEKRMDYVAQQRAQEPAAEKPRLESNMMRGVPQAKQAMPAPPVASKPMLPMDASNVLSLNQFVEFPSRDGFEISLDMTVEFELLPEHIAWIYQSYGDLPAVVDKIIMPQILSVSRLKGSAYRAKDFIVGEGREKFQNDLTEALGKTIEEKRIVIHDALIRHVNVPDQILDPIQQASIAVEQDLTNKEKQNTARKQAELNTELGLVEQRRQRVEQRRQQVAQETEKLKAEILADQEKQVAEHRAEALRQAAEIEQQTALVRADKTRKLGQAQANTVAWVEGEKAKGFELKAAAFGDPAAYTLWEFANNLNKDVRVNILHAGPGTLWTDLEKATLGELGGAAVLDRKR